MIDRALEGVSAPYKFAWGFFWFFDELSSSIRSWDNSSQNHKNMKKWLFLINSQKKTKKDKTFLFTISKIADLISNNQNF